MRFTSLRRVRNERCSVWHDCRNRFHRHCGGVSESGSYDSTFSRRK